MRFTSVDKNGNVQDPPMAQLAYGALVFVRTSIIRESAETCKKALTIAIRYCCVRRQFGTIPDDESNAIEQPIMNLATHKQRLIPLLAVAYAMHFTGSETTRIYHELMAILSTAKPGDARMKQALEALKECHGTSAGVKAHCTWKTAEIIDQCRQACGGQGYSSYAGLASLYADFVVQCTWEGDNTVLTLQAGRYLMSCFQERTTKGNRNLPPGVAYLNELALDARCEDGDNPVSITTIGRAFDQVCANLVSKAATEFVQDLKKRSKALGGAKKSQAENAAFEATAGSRLLAARFHCMAYMFHRFKDAVNKLEDRSSLKPVLIQLCTLYGLSCINDHTGPFLQYAFYTPQHVNMIHSEISTLLSALRPNVIALTDAFDLTDYVLNSSIGCHDGDVYRRVVEKTKAACPPKEHYYFEKVIKPVLHAKDRQVEQIPI